jgi:ATP-dependent protease ClpP protease subunit
MMLPVSSHARRRLLLLLGSALMPYPVRADGTSPPAEVISPAAPPAPARPAAPAAGAIDKTKSYYLFFEQTIDAASMKALRKQLVTLVEAGVAEITIVMASPGGLLFPALTTYSFIASLPANIDTHAQGFVASAATVLFLAGRRRSADRSAGFVFHPSLTTVQGSFNEQQMREQLAFMGDVQGSVARIYRERTRLADADIERFQRETVIYSAEQARELDIVQTVEDLRIQGERSKILFVE